MDTFAVDSMSTVGAVKAGSRQLKSYGTGAANVATVAFPLGLRLERLVREGKTTVSDLKAIKGPFEHAVKKSDACRPEAVAGPPGVTAPTTAQGPGSQPLLAAYSTASRASLLSFLAHDTILWAR